MNFEAIKPYKTLYLDTPDTGEIALPGSSEFVFLNTNFVTWCDVLARLNIPFMNAEVVSKFLPGPHHVSVFFPSYYHNKFKPRDVDNSIQRIVKLILNMKPPKNGIILTLYEIEDERVVTTDTWPFHTNTLWDFKRTWADKDTGYVTFQKMEKSNGTNWIKHHEELQDRVFDIVRKDFDVVFIDYSMETNSVVNLITDSRMHFSYPGASWWLSFYTKTPLFTYGGPGRVEKKNHLFGKHGSSYCVVPSSSPSVTQYNGTTFYNQNLPMVGAKFGETDDGYVLFSTRKDIKAVIDELYRNPLPRG